MKTLRLIFGDQLSPDISSLKGTDKARDVLLMVEVAEEASYAPHHKQKLAFIFSAMRHYAAERRAEGFNVDYVTLEDKANTGSFTGEVARAIKRHKPEALIVTEPGEWRVEQMIRGWSGVDVVMREDDRFFCSRGEFNAWAAGRNSYRMEFFYREMRKKTGLLMDGKTPRGGEWNYDSENRKPPPKGLKPNPAPRFAPDETTREVLDMVARKFAGNFGDLEPFGWATTRADALKVLNHFITHSLKHFGDYQDAMVQGEPFLWHAIISPYLNAGLLSPREVCAAAEKADAPLNAVEGFIRQILGWREYVRGLYWLKMPEYAETNHLNAKRKLPSFYWSGETDMNCMAEAIGDTKRHAYAHHIQRLMVTGNFALLAGLSPREVEEWYLAVYADAYEWVELPNTHGMVLFADGGVLASKPYAASGAYINRMSNYCKGCRYDVKQKLGPDACPFNYLYWDFLIRNEDKLKGNMRLAMPYKNLGRMGDADLEAIQKEAREFLGKI
jgi:deoxyribodipyrimidine photolyase-related protein